jgi:hypothetical protein
VGLSHSDQCSAQRGGLAGVDGDAGAAAAHIEGVNVIHAPLAADHDRKPRIEGVVVLQRARQIVTVVGIEQFHVAVDRLGNAAGVGGAGIGDVGEAQSACCPPGPDRPWRRGGEAAQHLGFLQQFPVAEGHFGEFAAQAGEFADPDDGLTADGAAHGFDGAAGGRGQIEQEPQSGIAQRVHGMIHLQCRLRRQPGSECQNALRRMILRALGDHKLGVAADLRTRVPRGPRNQDLRFRKQQRAEPVGFQLQALNVGVQPRLIARRAKPRAHQQDGCKHRKAQYGQR